MPSRQQQIRLEKAMRQPSDAASDIDVAVIIPCYNEEAAIGKVVRDFRAALPAAAIYVYDNRSDDETIARAE